MSMPTKQVELFSGTGGANAAFTSGTLDTTGFDAIFIEEHPSAAAAAAVIYLRDMGKVGAPSTVVGFIATPADASPNEVGWGLGVGTAATMGYYKGGLCAPLPASIKIDVDALGAGVTCYLRVIGIRRHKGPDVASIQD